MEEKKIFFLGVNFLNNDIKENKSEEVFVSVSFLSIYKYIRKSVIFPEGDVQAL